MRTRTRTRTLLAPLAFLPLLSISCVYDYAGLGGRPEDAGVGQASTGGAGGSSRGSGGSASMVPGAGGSAAGGAVGTGGTAVPGTGGVGGPGTGGSNDVGTGGSIPGTGGAGAGGGAGRGTGAGAGASSGGSGGAGGTGGRATGGGDGGGAPPSAPRILSIDFIGGYVMTSGAGGAGGAPPPLASLPAMAASEIAGVKRASHWNGAAGLAGSLMGLTMAGGAATTASVTWNSPPSATGRGTWTRGYTDAPGDVRMMNGYLDPHSADMPNLPATVVVNALPSALTTGGYDVYVYFSGDVPAGTTRTYRYSIGMAAVTATQAGPSPNTFSGYVLAPPGGSGNYVVFRNLTDSFFTLLATPGAGARAPVNGIQIVSPSGS